jgi:hypothetical protein
MQKKLAKLQAERRVFDFLAPLVGLRVLSDSIIQGDPPSPDVECQLKGGDGLAVELVALNAGDTRERLSNMNATDEPGRGRWRLGRQQTSKASGGIADMFLGLRIREGAGMCARTNINDLNSNTAAGAAPVSSQRPWIF